MYGQMTAGSWIYIGTQGILQGTYETFAAIAAKRFGGTLTGTITLTAGLGGMGGAQPLAVTMNGGVVICVECDQSRITPTDRVRLPGRTGRRRRRRHPPGRPPRRDENRPLSIGLLGNAADIFPQLLASSAPINIVTDQTSAHDPLTYLPRGVAFEDMAALRAEDPEGFTIRARESMAAQVAAMVGFLDAGAEVFDYGNSIRGEAELAGLRPGVRLPRLRPRLHQAAVLRGQGPVPLGRAVRRPGRHRRHRPGHPRPVPARTRPWPGGSGWPGRRSTSRACPRGSAGSATASATWPACASTRWSPAASCRPPSCSAATTWTAARSPRPTGRPRPWPTAPTRSPTGRCSTPWSTPPPAPPGCPSTTAAAWASAAPSTPARSAWPTAPTWPGPSWSAS